MMITVSVYYSGWVLNHHPVHTCPEKGTSRNTLTGCCCSVDPPATLGRVRRETVRQPQPPAQQQTGLSPPHDVELEPATIAAPMSKTEPEIAPEPKPN